VKTGIGGVWNDLSGADAARKLFNARPAAPTDRQWFRIEAKAGDAAEVFIYDEIGYWGTSAAEFAQQLAALDVKTINLRLNSPGGEVFEGVAIYNALKTHKATVNVSVDGLAASIASVIAMAGDTITVQRGAQMMIHDASGLAYGNAACMTQMADLLDKLSDTIAGFYAARAGGSLTSWRDTMRAETWFSPEEAVAAGLADVAAKDPAPENSAVPRHTWDLRGVLGYRYAARSEAPEPAEIDRTEPSGDPVDPEDATTDPDDSGAELSGDDLIDQMQELRDAMGPPRVELSLDELRSAVAFATTTLSEPAKPDLAVAPPPPADAWDDAPRIDLRDLRQSIREANL
jgi:ATP-dependent protease ClpP protease subunit